ncbi:LysO family transporter [Desulfotomaculum copahuensis]|uniref:Lysine exporter LysO family protein n=1 Tax=Desulfotomaculum copahuensis TaxID=1838280 RepID=A0A1B7LKH5_9FIRM|nr:LysO family transporter [Desulfotomaculum copahuensis]OAT87040.1 hypothetical protein A6M21_01715 [Desulfotomaculum copahuensis]
MSLLLFFLLTGVAVGYIRPLPAGGAKINQRIILAGLFVLLASMGAQLGANKMLLRHLDQMGLQALVLAGASVAGSVLLVQAAHLLYNRRRTARTAKTAGTAGKTVLSGGEEDGQ